MNSKLLILLSLVFTCLLLNSYYFLSQNSLEKREKLQERVFLLRGSEELFRVEWESFESIAQPSYASEEEENHRKEIFCKNAEEVMTFNDEANGKTRYTINLNSDRTQEELQETKFGIKLDNEQILLLEQYEIPELQQIAPMIDWRRALPAKGKNQGSCGSCWAQAAGQILEGIRAAQNGVIEQISIQHILDCTEVANGCLGHNCYHALQMTAQEGIIREDLYPYIARDQNVCPIKPKLPFKNAGVLSVGGDCNKLKSALQSGPIAVYLAAGAKFQSYSSGVLEDLTSTAQQVNHAVLLVGYTPDYWIIRNSWGDQFGMKGYYHIKMGNHAQICNHAFQATQDPKYNTAGGIKPSTVIYQDSIVIDKTPKIDFNKMVDKSFTVAFVNKNCAASLKGLSYLQIKDGQILFQPKSQTYVAKASSRIDFVVTGLQFGFQNQEGYVDKGTFIVDFEKVEGGKAKALALQHDDQFYMIQCTLSTGAPQAVSDKCSGKTDKTFVFYRTDNKGILNDDCTFGLTQMK